MKVALLWLAAPLWAQQSGATVEGVALDSITKAGIPGVVVTLSRASDRMKEIRKAETDAAGAFRMDDVPEGAYILWCNAPAGYLSPGSWTPAKPFTVSTNSPVPRQSIALVPLGKVRGRVTDPDGRPVANVRVEIFRVYGASASWGVTGADGRYQTEVVPGTYMLRARPLFEGTPAGRREKEFTTIKSKLPEGHIWGPTYYPSAIELSGAQQVFIREGTDLGGFDIRLRPVRAFGLRGKVVDDEGRPAAATVFLESEIGWGAADALAKSAADGLFEFPGVRPGQWRISVETQNKLRGFLTVTMPDRDFEGAIVRVHTPFEVEAVLEGLPPEAGALPMLWAVNGGDPLEKLPERNGNRFRIEGVYPGRYRAGTTAGPPGYYVKTILLGPNDVTGRDFELVGGTEPVRFLFQSNAAQAHGAVDDGAGAKVVLVATDPDVYIPREDIYVEVADGEGRFAFKGLRPGSYYAFAFLTHDNMNTGAIRDAVFQKGLDKQAPVTRVQEGETVELKLKLTAWPE